MNRRQIFALVSAVALTAPATASADAVRDWNSHATTAIVVNARQFPHVSMISYAMVQGAVYDAVNSIAKTHDPYLVSATATPFDSQDAAAATAAYLMLSSLFPSQSAQLQQAYERSLAAVPDGPAEDGGIAAGEAAAAAMLAARAGDGRGDPFAPTIGTTPGAWRPTPPFFALDPGAWIAHLRPFLVRDMDRLRTDGPNALSSEEYAREFAEVRALGSATSTTRTADQTAAALFWHTDAAVWPRTFLALASDSELSSAETARLLAMTTLGAADALIGCWMEKYRLNFWRPVTAIRDAAEDGNPLTEADPTWTPLLITPAMPDHPSGHACASSSIVGVLQSFFGADRQSFTMVNGVLGTSRSFERFSDATKEVIDARVWGGIHFRTADTQGAALGRKVAQDLRKHYFQPVD